MGPTGLNLRQNLGGLGRVLAWNGPLITLLALALALTTGLLLVQLPLLDGMLFVGLAVVGVATVIEPPVGLAAALFLGPLKAYLRTGVPQVPAQIGQLFVALTVAVWLARGLAGRDLRIRRPPLLLPLGVFLGVAYLSLWDAVELPVYGVPELIKWVQILVLFLFVSETLAAGVSRGGRAGHCPGLVAGMEGCTRPTSLAGVEICRTSRRLRWLLGALLVTGVFQAGVGVWQFGLRWEGPDHFAILDLGDRFYRAYGTFEQPNPYAGYIGMTLSLAIGAFIGAVKDKEIRGQGDRRARRRAPSRVSSSLCCLALLLVIIVLGAALAMSWSRGAWLGFGAAVLVMAVALPRQARWGLLLVSVIVVGALVLYATGLLSPSVVARLTDFVQDVRFEDVRGVGINDANYAVIERLAHWQAALEMFRHNLWTGVGLGCYEPAYSRFALINWPKALGHAHNIYLNLAAETGLIGLVAYVLLWGAVFWQTWRATRRVEGFLRGIAVGLLGAWTHLSVHHLLDNLYVNNVHLHVGVLLGILAFIVQRAGKSANRQVCKATESTTRTTDQLTNYGY